MGFISVVGKVFKGLTGPLGILEDWASEPLKRKRVRDASIYASKKYRSSFYS